MREAVIVRAGRTAIGKVNGIHREKEAYELAASVIGPLASGIEEKIDDVLLGNVVGPGGNVARVAALEAGLPVHVPGLTLDRQCSAGLEAVRLASLMVQAGAGNCFIAGGVESASTSPFPKRARFAPDRFGDPDMVPAAENVAKEYGIARAEQDAFARESHERSRAAFAEGTFSREIVDGQVDEALAKERNIARIISRARPLVDVQGATVTAANSCQINDGAAAVVVMEGQSAREYGLKPVLRFTDSFVIGADSNLPGAAPIPAIRELLQRNGLSVADIGRFEINEAFASKICAIAGTLGIPSERINPYGGALAIGHPYGASGAVLVTRLFHTADQHGSKYAVAAIGSGGGIGLAVLFEVLR
ncbi:acetyl-CoA C-acyltransferase [Aciduricibacillus chroicocephali]|uniref:Acetyl-CoA C-acyltransferase n=1 Tax=Aciduricibacillus chroicocephali TaxID=3054939 RepID=A0ABY9KXL9_9BACI|nr:acetyl-CoA C-acyltransferase [Bacillaceae bacterium 44XB]